MKVRFIGNFSFGNYIEEKEYEVLEVDGINNLILYLVVDEDRNKFWESKENFEIVKKYKWRRM